MLSAKKIILLVVAIVIVGGIVYVSLNVNRKQTYIAPTLTAFTENPILAKDTDNDGLKDWEEELWKTDKNKADTDGDGTLDGQEIKLGRNPLIKGPNDKLTKETVANKVNTEIEKDLSDTEKFSRELFLKIIAGKQSDTLPTEADIQKFLNASITQELAQQKTRSFVANDFQIDNVETPEKLMAYGNTIARIMTKKPATPLEDEIVVLDRATTNKSAKELVKLEDNINEYKRIEKELLQTLVPKSAVEQHVEFTNTIEGMIYSITGLKYVLSDPIKSLPGASAYADNSYYFWESLRNFKTFFVLKNISFSAGSDGYKLFNNI